MSDCCCYPVAGLRGVEGPPGPGFALYSGDDGLDLDAVDSDSVGVLKSGGSATLVVAEMGDYRVNWSIEVEGTAAACSLSVRVDGVAYQDGLYRGSYSNASGWFRLPALAPGSYVIEYLFATTSPGNGVNIRRRRIDWWLTG